MSDCRRPPRFGVGAAGVLALFAAAALATCRDQPTAPGHGSLGYLAVRPVVSAPAEVAAFGLVVDSVRIAAIRPVADTLADTTVFFDPNASTLQLEVRVLLQAPAETLLVHMELRSGTRVLFAGDAFGVASVTPDTIVAPDTLRYVGPGAGITHIQIAPRDTVVGLGLTQRFGASADSAGVPVDSFYVSWSTSDPASAPISTLGVLQAPGARGAVFVRAVTPRGVWDSTRVTFIPAPAAVSAVSGGGQTQAVATGLPQPLRVRVTATDQLGVKGIPVRFRAVTGGGSVRDSVVVTDSAGYAADSATLGSVAGAQTFSAAVTGLPAVNFSATALAGPISAAMSLVTVSSPSVTSGSAATLTLQAKDAFGNPIATGGATVTFTASGGTSTGTIGAVTDHGDGTYTASFVGVRAGTATSIGATVNGTAVTSTLPTLAVTAGAISAATSTVTVANPTVASGGTVSLTLQARDAAGNALSVGGATVVFTATGGTSTGSIGPTTDNGDGTYTAVFSGVLAGTATTIGATIGGATVTSALPTLTVTAGTISATTSVVTVSSATVASGASVTLTLTAQDAAGNALTAGGATVAFNTSGGTSSGTIGTVTDHGNGTYSASFVGVVAGTATTIGATVNGAAVTTTLPTITVTPGAISAAKSTVSVSANTVLSGAVVNLSLQARDAAGNALTTGGATVVFSATGGTSTGTIGPVTDNGDGTYGATFTGVIAGTATTIGASINDIQVSSALPTITVTVGAVSPTTSLVSTSSATVTAGANATLMLEARDAAGNPISSGGAVVVFTATGGTSSGTIGATTDNGDGTYSATFTGVTAGTATTIGATIDGVAATSTASLTVVPGNSVGAQSIVTVSASTTPSGGAVTLTLQARDSLGNDITTGGSTVTFSASGGTSTGTIGPTADNGNGTYTATFTGVLAGTATTIGATIDGASVTSTLPTVTVTAGAVSSTTSLVTVSAASVMAGGTVTLTLQAKDAAGNNLKAGGAIVVFTATGGTSTGTIGSTNDNGDGTYTATFTGVVAGTPTTIGATINGSAVTSTLPTITVTAGAISAATSVVSVSSGTVTSGDSVTLTLQAKDAAGNVLTSGGETVVFTDSGGVGASTGTIRPTPATDNGNGTYTAYFVGTLAGTPTTVGATINGTPVTSPRPTVSVTPGTISAVTSVVTVSSGTVASGSAVTLTLQGKDSAGNALTTGGATVVFSDSGGVGASTGTIGSTTDHGDGTYTASFTGVLVGTATSIRATVNGTLITTPRPTITVTPGAISAATSVVTVSSATVASGSVVTLTLQGKDSVGNALTSGGGSVAFGASGGSSTGTIAPATATDNGDGTYTASFTGVLAGTATTIDATINGNAVTSALPTITVTPGPISTATSVVSVSSSVIANGAVDTLRLQGKDAAGNTLTSGGATVVFTQSGGTSAGTIGATVDSGNGRYLAVFTATTAGTPTTIGATIAGNPVTSTPLPTIQVSGTSTTHSTDITANETWAAAQNPHIVTGYLRVRSGATLTIGAGARVQFDQGAGLQVGDTTLGESGGLVMDGTGGLITLTANTGTPTPGYWKGIELQNTLAVAPWTNVLIEWGGGTRAPAGAVAAEACLLVVNNSGAALVVDSLHIRQCNHAGIHHFGGDLTVRQSEIDSATGSGIHEDFKATLELDTSRVVGSGQEGLLVASAVARLRSMAGNVFLNNGIASIHMYGHQLRGFKQQDSIAGNGTLGGFGDSIVVDSGLIDGGGTGFTLHHQAGPYLFTGPIKVINAPVMLSRGFTAAFAPGAFFQVGDSTPGNDAQLLSQGTVDSQVVLRNRPGTAGWPGVFLGRQSAPPNLHYMRIVGGGYNPSASITANLLVDAAGASGPLAIDSLTSDSSRGHGVAILSAPASGFRVRDDSIRNSAGIGLLVFPAGSAADTISGNVLVGNQYQQVLTLSVDSFPLWTAVNSVTNRIYVSQGTGNVAVIDGATNTVSQVAVGANVGAKTHGITVNPTTNRIYAAQDVGNWIYEIDGATNAVDSMSAGDAGSSLAGIEVDSTRNLVYAPAQYCLGTLQCSFVPFLAILDPVTKSLVDTVRIGGSGTAVAFNPTNDRIYVATSSGSSFDTVKVIDAKIDSVVDSIEVGAGVNEVAANPVTNRIYVANTTDGTVSVIDGGTDAVIATVSVNGQPYGLGVDPVTNRVYVPVYGGTSVQIIDGATNQVVGQIPVGDTGATDAEPNPATGRVYVPLFLNAAVRVVVP